MKLLCRLALLLSVLCAAASCSGNHSGASGTSQNKPAAPLIWDSGQWDVNSWN